MVSWTLVGVQQSVTLEAGSPQRGGGSGAREGAPETQGRPIRSSPSSQKCHHLPVWQLKELKSTIFSSFKFPLGFMLPGEAQRIKNCNLMSHSLASPTSRLTLPCLPFPASYGTHSLRHPSPCRFLRCRLTLEQKACNPSIGGRGRRIRRARSGSGYGLLTKYLPTLRKALGFLITNITYKPKTQLAF